MNANNRILTLPLAALLLCSSAACSTKPDLTFFDPGIKPGNSTKGTARASSVDELRREFDARLAPTIEPPIGARLLYFVSQGRNRDSLLDSLDFSGVSIGLRTATLIHPQYAVMARHYPKSVGETLRWRERSGIEHSRQIAKGCGIPPMPGGWMPDIWLVKLDSPLPSSITYYPVMPAGYDYSWLRDAPTIALHQNPVPMASLLSRTRPSLRATDEQIRYHDDDREFADGWAGSFIVGDSGCPTFLLLRGQLVLLGTHHYGGIRSVSGPTLLGSWTQQSVRYALSRDLEPE